LKINTQVQSPAVAALEARGEEFSIKVKGLGRRVICAFMQIQVQDQSGPFILALSNDVIEGLMKVSAKPQPAPAAAPPPKPKAAPQPASATVQPAVFQPLQEKAIPGKPGNLDLLLDIGLDVRVELGRTGMKIRDVLELGPGSVLELDKLAGEPVDLLINDKLFARGEVVVIDENFGVRVTDILNMEERIQALGEK
jgi:flagellar motor switch protein FliN